MLIVLYSENFPIVSKTTLKTTKLSFIRTLWLGYVDSDKYSASFDYLQRVDNTPV